MTIRKNFLLNPVSYFAGVWLLIFVLHSLALSTRLTSGLVFLQLVTFLIFYYTLGATLAVPLSRKIYNRVEISEAHINGSVRIVYFGTAFLALLEFAIEGYVPVLALAAGRSISHFDFGISSVHGFILASFSALGTFYFALYLTTSNRKHLYLALIPIVFSILVVSRKMTTVCFIQYVVVYLFVMRPRPSVILKSLVFILLFILFFGLIGDLRGRSDILTSYGGLKPIFDFPGSTGFKWVYLYITTPLENLKYTATVFPPENSGFPVRTYGGLIPSAITDLFTGSSSTDRFAAKSVERYWLQSAVFNISTGFNSPYLDNGWLGMGLQSGFMGFLSFYSFLRSRSTVGFCVTASLVAASCLTIFSNNFGNLNFVGQFLVYGLMAKDVRMKSFRFG